jgi:hypothetical protein
VGPPKEDDLAVKAMVMQVTIGQTPKKLCNCTVGFPQISPSPLQLSNRETQLLGPDFVKRELIAGWWFQPL